MKFSTYIITSITLRPIRLAVILVIMSVSTFITAIILLYIGFIETELPDIHHLVYAVWKGSSSFVMNCQICGCDLHLLYIIPCEFCFVYFCNQIHIHKMLTYSLFCCKDFTRDWQTTILVFVFVYTSYEPNNFYIFLSIVQSHVC